MKRNYLLIILLIITFTSTSPTVAQNPSIKFVTKVAWNHDGQMIAIASSKGVYVFEQDLRLKGILTSDFTYDVDWNHNKNLLALIQINSSSYSTIEIWDIDTMQKISTLEDNRGYVDNLVYLMWSPVDEYVAVSGRGVRVWDINTEEPLFTGDTNQDFGNISGDIVWSSDGQYIATSYVDELKVWNPHTGELIFENNSWINGRVISWSPDSSELAVSYNGEINIINLDQRELQSNIKIQDIPIQSFTWDNNYIVGSADNSSISGTKFYIWDTTNENLEETIQSNNSVSLFDISPTSRQITSFDEVNQVFLKSTSILLTTSSLNNTLTGCIVDEDIKSSFQSYITNGRLSDFASEVESQRGAAISDECADELIEMANLLLEAGAE